MVRYLGWLANTALFALCCFLVADTANAIIAALLQATPATSANAAPSARAALPSWDDRQIIVSRNLFHSTELTPSVPEPVSEDLEETKLPLKLWGTIASENPALAWATVEELDAHESSAVSVGDQIKSATVLDIERRRIVLLENGKRRSLTLEEQEPSASSFRPTSLSRSRLRSRVSARARRSGRSPRVSRSTPTSQSIAESMSERVKKLADDRFEVNRADIVEAMNNPASLYTQARILPHIDETTGEMVGVQISSIKAGSVFEQVGIQDGEVITEIDGVPIGDIGQSAQMFGALTEQSEVAITVLDADGNSRPLTLILPAE